MELKAYQEKICTCWWLFLLVAAGALLPGLWISAKQSSLSTVTAIVDLSGVRQIQENIPSPLIHLNEMNAPQAQIATPFQLAKLCQIYPSLTVAQLQKNIQITLNRQHQLLIIDVTDQSTAKAVTIANYLARSFIRVQITRLHTQLMRNENWLQQNIPLLELRIKHLQQALHQRPGTISSLKNPIIRERQNIESRLYIYQTSLDDIRDTSNLLNYSYELLQPARADGSLTIPAMNQAEVLFISVGGSQLVLLMILVGFEYNAAIIRHVGELERLTGGPVLLNISSKSLCRRDVINWEQALNSFNTIKKSETSCKTLLIAGNSKSLMLTEQLATRLAEQRQRTLLVNNFPTTRRVNHHQTSLQLSTRVAFSHIYHSVQPFLFLLKSYPYTPLVSIDLLITLPELQQMFDWIIIAAPSLSEPETRLLATRVTRTWLLVSKRHDRLQEIEANSDFCLHNTLQHDYLFCSQV